MDGRDTAPKSGKAFLGELLDHIADQRATVASVIGRYYAMDRDKRWERIKLAYDLMVKGEGEASKDALATIAERYEGGETDEFLKPITCVNEDNEPIATVKDGDILICFNFRTDRPREISQVLTQEDMPDQDMK
jgi:2,3-bisphosphoglycerate-independent phosphoglycerate mutase